MRMLLKTSRRTFLKGLALSGVAEVLACMEFQCAFQSETCQLPHLQGTQFDLTIGETAVNITGGGVRGKTINGDTGAVLHAGKKVTPYLRSKQMYEQTSIHWHGIILQPSHGWCSGAEFLWA